MMPLNPPRWANGPKMCPSANLPAFDSVAEMDRFKEINCPSVMVIARWVCNGCGLHHFWGIGAGPSGASSGTTRAAKHIEGETERFFSSVVAKTIKVKL